MGERILETLEPVRRRQLGLEIVRCSAIGLLAGSLLAVVAGRLALAGLPGGGRRALGGGVPAGRPGSRRARRPVARAGRSGWRPRPSIAATTSRTGPPPPIDFIRRGQPTPLHVLQVADAEQHLAGIDVRRVAPFRMPRVMPYALAATALALGLLLWPRPTRGSRQAGRAARAVLAAADRGRGEPRRPARKPPRRKTTPSSKSWCRS